MLRGTWAIARALGVDPNVVLRWRESKFWLWLAVHHDELRREGLVTACGTSAAVWHPKSLTGLFGAGARPPTREDARAAIAKAEAIAARNDMVETT